MKTITKTKFKQTEMGMIPEDWEVKKLSDLTVKITKGTTPTTVGGKFVEKGINFIKVESLKEDGTIQKEKLMHIDVKTDEMLARSRLQKNDLLYSIAGTIGRVSIVNEDILPANTNQAIAILRPDINKINLLYLRYALVNPELKNYLLSKVVHAVQANLSLTEISNCPVPFPSDEEEQRAIAKILSDLDSKIELNQQVNKTVEAIGQALFKHWFIDLEEIPEGWETKHLDEIAGFLNGLALQKYTAKEGEAYLPAIKIRELRSGITEQTDKVSLNLPKEYIVEDGDILFSWSGSLEVVIWTNGKGALNQHLFKVASKEYPKWFYYYWTKHHLPNFRRIAEGKATTMGHIQKHDLSESEVLVPDKRALDKMDCLMNPILKKIIALNLETHNLAKIRDLLLPKLMSGEIRVK